MEIEQVAELARAVAALPQSEKDFFDGLVADERAKAAEAERIAELQASADLDVVHCVLNECTEYADAYHEVAALKMLREAGFVRLINVSDDEALRGACLLVRNSPLVRMLVGRDAGRALCDELANRAATPVGGFQEGVVYNKGDRVMVRGRVYECLSDGVTAFYRAEGDPAAEVPRLTTPNWQAVGEAA